MRLTFRRRLLLIVLCTLAAAALRVYHLGASPLRGDEAFTIRYWAAPLPDVLTLAQTEPHPFGALLGYGAWKALVGSSEFAARSLSALLNLIGVPAIYALGRRLLRDDHVGLIAALLWAVNPYQLWHAQDARDYAMWASLSALAMWLLLCACDRRRRRDWLLYVLAATAALYVFFLEAFFVIVGGVAIGLRAGLRARSVWRRWLLSLTGMAVLLIPWWAQVWALAHSGYRGSATTITLSDVSQILTHFLPSLYVGDVLPSLAELWSTLLLFLLLSVWLLARRGRGSTARFLIVYAVLPALLLTVAATRIAVFQARYVIAVTPALLLIAAYGLASLRRSLAYRTRYAAWGLIGMFALIFVVMPLIAYSESRKAPDWFGLRTYLDQHVQPGDLVLLTTLDPATGNGDPAFGYYFDGRADSYTLPRAGIDSAAYVREAAQRYRAIWFIPSGDYAAGVDEALRDNLQLLSDEGAGQQLIVREYRSPVLKPAEISQPQIIRAGDFTLQGYSLERSAVHLTVVLYWQPGGHTTDTVFVHLIGAINPKTGTPLWAGHDHPPLAAPRDVYRLDLGGIPPGSYQIEIGLYDPASGQRRALIGADGQSLGDSALLTEITLGP